MLIDAIQIHVEEKIPLEISQNMQYKSKGNQQNRFFCMTMENTVESGL
jgi:hypothetical protein